MTVYIAQAFCAFDGNDASDAWAQGQAQWVKNNTEVLAGQARVVPGTAGERSSYCVVSQVEPDGSLTTISAWHVNGAGVLTEGLPDGSGRPDPVGLPPWRPWPGAGPTYQVGDRVKHNGSAWESTVANNVWEPGVFGWVVV